MCLALYTVFLQLRISLRSWDYFLMLQRKKLRLWELTTMTNNTVTGTVCFCSAGRPDSSLKTKWSEENAAGLTFSHSFSAPLPQAASHPPSCSLWSAAGAWAGLLTTGDHSFQSQEGTSDTYIFSKLWTLRGPRSSEILIPVRTPSTQILVSKYHSPAKEQELFGEVVDLRAGNHSGKIQEPRASLGSRK